MTCRNACGGWKNYVRYAEGETWCIVCVGVPPDPAARYCPCCGKRVRTRPYNSQKRHRDTFREWRLGRERQ